MSASSLILRSSSLLVPLPAPRVALNIRPATMADVPFMDSLQKVHARQLGYFPTKQFEGYVEMGSVLIAETGGRHSVTPAAGTAALQVGYIISRDRYLKRDELGVVYQLVVTPGVQRHFVGAALLKAVFDRSAYGCKLYCCWCAQDLPANKFWESMGFVPLAFRGGSVKKKGLRGGGRVHIFWQKRIRAGDEGLGATPWWFPAKTDGGAMREDRLVLPIPPHLHWSDQMPALRASSNSDSCALEDKSPPKRQSKRAIQREPGDVCGPQEPTKRPRHVQFGPPSAQQPTPSATPLPTPVAEKAAKRARPTRVKEKCDPALVAGARELRDRWLEEVDADPALLLPQGKYEVARALPELPGAMRRIERDDPPLLPAAA